MKRALSDDQKNSQHGLFLGDSTYRIIYRKQCDTDLLEDMMKWNSRRVKFTCEEEDEHVLHAKET